MRITRDTLMKIARDTAAQRARQDRSLICIYLTGSLVFEDDILLGGTTDIDLVMIHDHEPAQEREFVRLSDEVHLDIAHYSQTRYARARALRLDPWIGSYLREDPICLYDLQHWFEFTQANVSAQFNLPETVLARCRPLAERARQAWLDLSQQQSAPDPQTLLVYFRALADAANAIACLDGPPLTERRMLLNLPARAEALGRPGLAAGLVDLCSRQELDQDTWQSFAADWTASLNEVSQLNSRPQRLAACRVPYYTRAALAVPAVMPWVMLRTWTAAEAALGKNSPTRSRWLELTHLTGLDREQFPSQIEALDAYLDSVEETLDLWAQKFGI